MNDVKLRIGVTPKGFDDIGAILHQAGYTFSELPINHLANLEQLQAFDVVFINCAGDCRGKGQKEASALRAYVAEGGSLYASDYASDLISVAFSEYVSFGAFDGQAQTIQAKVVDPGLQATLGKTAKLVFDAPGWRKIKAVPKSQVHLMREEEPILVSFDHGKGHVVFTCFHNHRALSNKDEATLLNYLVLKPLTARAALPAKQRIQLELSREFIFSLTPGSTSNWHEYPAVGGEPLVFALSWQGQAHCELLVQAPDGSLQQKAVNQSPVQIFVPMALGGVWRAQTRLVTATASQLAMHLLIGPPKSPEEFSSVVQAEQPLDIRVLGTTELPIKVLSQQSLVPLPIRRLDEE